MDGVSKHGERAAWVIPGIQTQAVAKAPFLHRLTLAEELGDSRFPVLEVLSHHIHVAWDPVGLIERDVVLQGQGKVEQLTTSQDIIDTVRVRTQPVVDLRLLDENGQLRVVEKLCRR
jgi:hypothetical protein